MGEWQNPHHRADMQKNTTLGNKNSEKVKVKQVNGNTPIIRADIHTNTTWRKMFRKSERKMSEW